MLIPLRTLEQIRQGSIDLAFRRWARPTVKTGGTLRTAIGLLRIDAVDAVELDAVTDRQARRAGFADVHALVTELDRHRDGQLYRIRFHLEGDDPRIALRESAALTTADVASITTRLDRMDRASSHGPWTRHYLRIVAAHPGRRAPDLATMVGRETQPFKTDVRKLTNLGLTVSLRVGYELSPRGQAYLDATASPTKESG
ncbi:MAG: hypothetical protein ACXVJ7_09690 [Acidimicrobiia bacterium]